MNDIWAGNGRSEAIMAVVGMCSEPLETRDGLVIPTGLKPTTLPGRPYTYNFFPNRDSEILMQKVKMGLDSTGRCVKCRDHPWRR